MCILCMLMHLYISIYKRNDKSKHEQDSHIHVTPTESYVLNHKPQIRIWRHPVYVLLRDGIYSVQCVL